MANGDMHSEPIGSNGDPAGMPGEDELQRAVDAFRAGAAGLVKVLGGRVVQREIEVVPGNTLWQLAGQHLGDPQRWREIYLMNLDVMARNQEAHRAEPGPNLIYPDTKLVILPI
jgi:nucleoid-associated protein YgaU